ncbi:putative outer membrane starch-binding protein [Mucilaginibacter yixingensis]|uniref:Putative outer membrane starch-binding protein n=1 Tax=Mucilaginibacter yixingensis TaxID=1295612 RepID=A0A2T5J8M8_9SPHI|nr:RagB/SusD family nutrient uptake outer membrane protein [Mucilaginibacter yixingensis]PTQ95749.1 putative outer membrane starch-binding protein [Mucilaginibacter yixingensis]
MRKVFAIIISTGAAALMFSSCKKVLDKQDLGNFTAAQVYNDSTVAKSSMDYIYSQNQPSWFGNSGGTISGQLSGLTDEAYSDNAFVKGTVTIESVTDLGASASSGNYTKIRTINMFIRDINAGTMADGVKARYNAQAYFWRAYRYFELVKLYGGVPIVTTPLDAVGDEAKKAAALPRNTTTETFNQIVSDLNTAIAALPINWPNTADYGRITKGAAQAFLGRVLLTWASPQFNASNDQARWQAAYDANTAAIATLTTGGYGLYSKWDVSMWTTEGGISGGKPGNPEAVLVTEYNTSTTDIYQNNNSYTGGTIPKSLGGSGSNQPTWDLARAFPMKDGKDTLTSKYAYTAQNFYNNRDPRFAQTIAYNGCNWSLEGNSAYRLWTYYYYSSATAVKSTESSASTTGLYLRKGVDPTITNSNLTYSGTDWIEIRYAEVLLNQAEAAAELGRLGTAQEAYANLIAIRKRAGIEAGTDNMYGLTTGMNHDQMITAIMKERQIEFAFEGKRYWDLRRRKLLESTLNGKRRSGVVFTLAKSGTNFTDYILNTRDASANTNLDAMYNTTGAGTFVVSTKTLDTYNIAYQTADYFFGIPTTSLNNNVNLVQNNTWGGSFDPTK